MNIERQVINNAKLAYQKVFEDLHELNLNKENDVVLNKEKLTEDINRKKTKEMNKAHSLKVLKDSILDEAKESLENVFVMNNTNIDVSDNESEKDYQVKNIEWGKHLRSM